MGDTLPPEGGVTSWTSVSGCADPNGLWCADDKGEFMLGNRRSCYPLTVTDFASRYLLTCEALSTTPERFAFTAFDRTFREFGLPAAIRTDNGVPFASPTALYRFSKLAVGWLRLGIRIERIAPVIRSKRPARADASHAKGRSHQARGPTASGLGMKVPADLYTRSARVYRARRTCPSVCRRDGHRDALPAGSASTAARSISLSHVFAGQNVGVTQVGDHLGVVTFMHYDLGYFDGASRLRIPLARKCYLCARNKPSPM
jgi:putative transposase